MEDLSAPEWSRIVPTAPDNDDDTPVFTGAAFEEPLYPSAPEPPENSGEGKRKREKRAPKPKGSKGKRQPTAREGKTNQYAGGRWKIKILRGLIFTVLLVLLAGGTKNVLTSEEKVSTEDLAKQVQAELGFTGFPTDTAETFAVRFVREYLTFEQATIEARALRLGIYSPAAAEGNWGWDGQGSQSVIAGPYVSAPTKVDGANFATVTVSAQVSSGAWVALAVPIYAAESGALVVAGAPAFVAQPALAVNPGKEEEIEVDEELSAVLTEDVLPGFLSAWAASDQTSLARYITSDASVAAQTGLAGTVTFASIEELTVPIGKETRTGTVTVLWKTAAAGSFVQDYTITVVEGADGRYSVQDIAGGVVATSADAGTVVPEDGQTGTGPVQLPGDVEPE